MTRRELRETVFKLLYLQEFHSAEQLEIQLDLYFSNPLNGEFTAEDREYISGKLANILSHESDIDKTIDTCSEGWKLSRLNRVDLSILRLAVYEIAYDEDIPYRVAINEAVEIAKKYGSDESPSFINGILGKAASLMGLSDDPND